MSKLKHLIFIVSQYLLPIYALNNLAYEARCRLYASEDLFDLKNAFPT